MTLAEAKKRFPVGQLVWMKQIHTRGLIDVFGAIRAAVLWETGHYSDVDLRLIEPIQPIPCSDGYYAGQFEAIPEPEQAVTT